MCFSVCVSAREQVAMDAKFFLAILADGTCPHSTLIRQTVMAAQKIQISSTRAFSGEICNRNELADRSLDLDHYRHMKRMLYVVAAAGQ